MLCLSPLLFVGYLVTVHPNVSHTTIIQEPILQLLTCDRGWGLDLKVTASAMTGLSAHYGWKWEHAHWSWGLLPKVGVAQLPHAVPELASTTNFSTGMQVWVGYQTWRMGVEYWHQSNAGFGTPNVGLDLLVFTGGLQF